MGQANARSRFEERCRQGMEKKYAIDELMAWRINELLDVVSGGKIKILGKNEELTKSEFVNRMRLK